MKKIIIRQHPFVLIKLILTAQIALTIIFSLINYLLNLARPTLFLGLLDPISPLKIIFLASAEFVILLFLFAHWYSNTYQVSKQKITHTYGFIFKNTQTTTLPEKIFHLQHQNFFGRRFNFQTLNITNTQYQNVFTFQDVATQDKNAILKFLDQPTTKSKFSFQINDPKKLITLPESEHLEFKASLRVDTRTKKINKALEQACIKVISAFMNSAGGILILGVDDSGKIIGLSPDFASLSKKTKDGFENHLNQIINQSLGAQNHKLISISFHDLKNKTICMLKIKPSPSPMFVTQNGSEYFYIKTGNSTTPLTISQAVSYINSQFNKNQ